MFVKTKEKKLKSARLELASKSQQRKCFILAVNQQSIRAIQASLDIISNHDSQNDFYFLRIDIVTLLIHSRMFADGQLFGSNKKKTRVLKIIKPAKFLANRLPKWKKEFLFTKCSKLNET